VRQFPGKLGFAFSITGAAIGLFLHVAMFFTTIPLPWILVPFALLFAAVGCGQAVKAGRRYQKPARNWKLFGYAALGYAVLTFVYFYRTMGGASGVSIVDGRYVSMYQDRILSTITETQYRMFPILLSRVMSAWIGMTAFFYLTQSPAMGDRGRSGSLVF